jgi:hypothetical protein
MKSLKRPKAVFMPSRFCWATLKPAQTGQARFFHQAHDRRRAWLRHHVGQALLNTWERPGERA